MIIAVVPNFMHFVQFNSTKFLHPVIFSYFAFVDANLLYMRFSDCGSTKFHAFWGVQINNVVTSSEFFLIFGVLLHPLIFSYFFSWTRSSYTCVIIAVVPNFMHFGEFNSTKFLHPVIFSYFVFMAAKLIYYAL